MTKNKKIAPKNTKMENLKPFTSEHQPSPKAKSEGVKRWWDRKKLKEDMFKAFAEPLITSDGKTIEPCEAGVDLLKKALFSKGMTPISKRAELFLKICDFLGIKENDLTMSNPDGSPMQIIVNFVEPKPKKSNDNK